MKKTHLNIDHISMEFPTPDGSYVALRDVNLEMAEGEFVSLIGHSGCGKSTVLNVVAGLHKATRGGVVLDGKEVDEPGPERAVVFQNHSLLPWLTAYENVELAVKQVFGRDRSKVSKSKAEIKEWIEHNLHLVHMDHAMHKRPDEISGGMKQRVGIARALAMEPKVLLMDEPFGALDALTRAHMQESLMEIHADLGNTVIMITHDVDEAVLLSDRIVMMTNGPAATIGEILEIDLPRPRDRVELAEDPAYNHYRAEVVRFLHERQQNPEREATQLTQTASTDNVLTLPTQNITPGNASSDRLEKTRLSLGFIPLTDCAPLVVASEKGYFKKYGLDVELSKESSWSNIRDKVCAGVLDGAQMLAAMPLSSVLQNQHCEPMVTAMSLDLNGNAITVSKELYGRMVATGIEDVNTPCGAARALKAVIDQDKARQAEKLTFAIVYPESSHNYLLRYWLADAGIDPDKDVRLRVVPPPQMANYLRAGMIAGYCVGEPWNSYAVSEGFGRTLLASYEIWNNHPEKVFAVTRDWAQEYPNTHIAVISALLEACQWLDQADNRVQASELLHHGRYVDAPADVLEKSLTGNLRFNAEERPRLSSDFNVFYRYAANFPWRSHALWFLSQMKRWGQYDSPFAPEDIAQSVYQPEVYREAARRAGLRVPGMNSKQEGVHGQCWQLDDSGIELGADQFMDGRVFDPQAFDDYVDSFEIRRTGDSNQSVKGQTWR
jgi:nitrate ABC transporter ATP-binding subunit